MLAQRELDRACFNVDRCCRLRHNACESRNEVPPRLPVPHAPGLSPSTKTISQSNVSFAFLAERGSRRAGLLTSPYGKAARTIGRAKTKSQRRTILTGVWTPLPG